MQISKRPVAAAKILSQQIQCDGADHDHQQGYVADFRQLLFIEEIADTGSHDDADRTPCGIGDPKIDSQQGNAKQPVTYRVSQHADDGRFWVCEAFRGHYEGRCDRFGQDRDGEQDV